jgi:predicted methyltransferase
MRALALAFAATTVLAAPALAQAPSAALREAVSGPHRTEANRARDQYRHPAETLAFFGVKPTDTVVELWPGGGWYTEILTSYLGKGGGQLIVAAPTAKGLEGTQKRLTARPELFGKVQAVNFPTVLGGTGVAPGTADVVLTFRNVHNWRGGYMHPEKADYSAEAFREIFAMLKPGGVLGITAKRPAATSRPRPSGSWPSRPASASPARPRSTPTRRTRPTGRRASGRCRPTMPRARPIAPSTRRSAKATG